MSAISDMAERFGPSYKWVATITVMLGTIATTAASTIVNVAITDITGAFGLGQDQAQWLSTGFLASMTATMLLTAWTLGQVGYRATFVGGMSVFIFGCVLGAMSTNSGEVITARVLQGCAAGIVQPLAMVVISQVFPIEQRGAAMGIYGVGIVLAPALGPTLGGVMVDQYSWREVFLVVVPLCIAAIISALFFLPRHDRASSQRTPFDLPGFCLLSIALTTLLSGLSNGQRDGWSSNTILMLFALAVLSTAGFVIRELIAQHPLLNVKVFANGRFTAACLVAFTLGAGIYGSTYIVPQFVQTVQGYTPTRSGILLMPSGLVLALVFPIAGRLSDRLPSYLLVSTGLFIFGYSCWLSRAVDVDTPFWTLAFWILLGRIGLGVMLPALNAGALRSLPFEQLAQGSGSLNFTRQLGGAFGVNLLTVFVERRTTFHGDALAQAMTPDNPAVNTAIQQLSLILAHWGNPFGDRSGSSFPPAALAYLESMLGPKASMLAYQDGFYIVALVFFSAILPAWFLRQRKRNAS